MLDGGSRKSRKHKIDPDPRPISLTEQNHLQVKGLANPTLEERNLQIQVLEAQNMRPGLKPKASSSNKWYKKERVLIPSSHGSRKEN